MTYVDHPMPAPDAAGLVPEGVEPTRVLRFASPCEATCGHRVGGGCGLVTKVAAAAVPVQIATLPRCHLRSRCTWWAQAGADACHRCPLIRTAGYEDDLRMRLISDPDIDLDQLTAALAAGAGPGEDPDAVGRSSDR
ncbi:MAG TPA: hypothetical protein VFT95_22890 [Micromonosporaceae bacterium]|nr:hypothetical protein [Micromonosporaceae bacterium]